MTMTIAIVGAGPGGLLCALVLQQHGIAATVYDTDASADARDAGGSLDLHADTGQIALADAGLLDEFMTVARAEDQSKRMIDMHGAERGSFQHDEDDTAAPEIDRGQLRALIAGHVRPENVRWGHRLTGAAALGDGRHRLAFANGTTTDADLVIGADGVWSRVRPLVSDVVPEYSGVTFLDVRYDDADRRHPALAAVMGGKGHMFARGDDGNAIIAQRNSNGVIRGYLAMRTEADWARRAGVHVDDRPGLHAYLRERYAAWSPGLQPFLTDSDDYVERGIWFLPTPMTWPHRPGVTLLGDAAHAMGPFGGYGVNLALLDAAELARALAKEQTLDDAVRRYEHAMQIRAAGYAASSNLATRRFSGIVAGAEASAAAEASAGPAASATDEQPEPDHAESHRAYRAGADRYRLAREATGDWRIRFDTPGGTRTAELILQAVDQELTGSLDGRPFDRARVDGGRLRFRARISSPFPATLDCEATVDGDTITGVARHTMMTLAFSGDRISEVTGPAAPPA
ncbi:NAD(P)/FAD-dependent oxidoreductase [Actinoplanes sp. NPDC089786]|uniref:FAD-dependent oxidoreductase n=1 Tax=Actinoplanes sp. NPDC089786 TaxID=3155185 RepID=UPI00342D972C